MRYARVLTTMTCLSALLFLPACAKSSKTRVASDDRSHGQVQSQDIAAGTSHPSQERLERPVASTSPITCVQHRDSRGRMVYDNPACADKYRRQQTEVAAVCASFVDRGDQIRMSGDPNYPDRPSASRMVEPVQDPTHPDQNRLAVDPNYPDRTRSSTTAEPVQDPALHDGNVNTALNNVLNAEAAGNEGNIPEMLRRTRMSLDGVNALQGAGNNPYLHSAVMDLREAMTVGCRNQIAPAALGDARAKLSQAALAGGSTHALKTGSRLTTQTVTGELVRDTSSSGTMSGEHFLVRDRQNNEIPIRLSPEMSTQVHPGDIVEAQIDSKGEVVAISKAQ